MNLDPISDHAWKLTRYGLVNCYLVRESDGFTLIDTGLSGSAQDIFDCAQDASPGTEICRILLTHAHMDHIGSLDALAHMLGNPQVAISRRDARLLPKPPAQDLTLDPGEPQTPIRGGLPGATTAPTHFVSDGELYGSLRCLSTPGHTPGHFSYFDERDGTLYTGDQFVNIGGHLHISGFGPWYFPLPAAATWHKPTCVTSAQRLGALNLPIQRYAAGHGRLIEAGPELIVQSLRKTI